MRKKPNSRTTSLMKKIWLNSYIFLFGFILLIPTVIKVLDIDINPNLNEKREILKAPSFKLNKEFTKDFENYYNNNFGLRSFLVELNASLKINFLNVSPHPLSVKFGNQGFLFYNKNDIYQSYSNNNIMTPEMISQAFKTQIEIKDSLRERDIQYLIGFFPNKHTIYNENLPFSMKIQKKREISLADQVASYFKERKFSIIDVRKDMINAKSKNQLYYKFDTHWNSFGGYIGYQSFCKQTFSELKLTPYKLKDFDISYREIAKGDLTNMLGIESMTSIVDTYPVFNINNKDLAFSYTKIEGLPEKSIVTTNETCQNKKTILILGDSYGNAFYQFLSLHYSKLVYVRRRFPDEKVIQLVKPDIILNLSVERFFQINITNAEKSKYS